MTRQECEAKLIELTERAFEILREFDPNAAKMALYINDGQINVNGMTQGVNIDTADYSDTEKTYNVYATKFPDGEVWHSDRWARSFEQASA